MPRQTEPSGEIPSAKKYTIPLAIIFFLLALCSLIQGIVAITFGSLFNSFSLSTFGISSIGQMIIIFYLYHKLITEHYVKKLTTTATESTPILNSRNSINSRRTVEKKLAITGMFIYILLTAITLVSLFYINKQMDNDPKEPTKPPTKPPGDDGERPKPFIYVLLFSIYAIHPFFIVIPFSWYFASSSQSLVWREATVWAALLFLMAYIQFVNSQLLYFVAWKTREIVCTLMMAVLFAIYAIRFFCLYLWRSDSEIRYRPILEE